MNWIEARLRGYLAPAVERGGAEELRDAVAAHEGVEAAGAPADAPHHLLGAQVLLLLQPRHQKIQAEYIQNFTHSLMP